MITDRQIKLVIGSLLHDIGKVVYRSGDGRNHSQSGYEYLKTESKNFRSEYFKLRSVSPWKKFKNSTGRR